MNSGFPSAPDQGVLNLWVQERWGRSRTRAHPSADRPEVCVLDADGRFDLITGW